MFWGFSGTSLFDGQIRGKEIEAHYARVHRLFDKIVEKCAGEERQISDQMFGRKVQNDRLSSYPARSGCGEGIFYHYPNLFAYYRQLAGVLEKKAEIGLHIREAYDDGRKEELGRLSGILKELAVMVWELKEMRKQIWFLECKPFGIESPDIRFAGVYTRLLSAADRLSDYAAGRIDRIEELEEPRIYFDSTQKASLVSVPYWEDIVSAGNICGI